VRLPGADPDHAQRDLFNAIATVTFPGGRLIQVMTEPVAAAWEKKTAGNPFDLTKCGHMEISANSGGHPRTNRNPDNYHEHVEQAAFSPAQHVGQGLQSRQDAAGRLFAYHDAQLYRDGHQSSAFAR